MKVPVKLFKSKIFKLVLATVFLLLLFHMVPIAEVKKAISQLQGLDYAMAVGLNLLLMLWQAIRWRYLLLVDKSEIPGIGYFFRYIGVGYFANIFLPGGFGGDVVKSVGLGRNLNALKESVSAIVLGRVLGLLALLVIFALGYFFRSSDLQSSVWLFTTVAIISSSSILFFLYIFFWGELKERPGKIGSLIQALQAYRNHKKVVFNGFGLSLLTQFTNISMLWLINRSIGMPIDIFQGFMIFPLIVFATMIPISLFNIGVREGASVFFLTALAGISAEICIAGSFATYGVVLVPVGLGGIFVLLGKNKKGS